MSCQWQTNPWAIVIIGKSSQAWTFLATLSRGLNLSSNSYTGEEKLYTNPKLVMMSPHVRLSVLSVCWRPWTFTSGTGSSLPKMVVSTSSAPMLSCAKSRNLTHEVTSFNVWKGDKRWWTPFRTTSNTLSIKSSIEICKSCYITLV